MYSKPYLRLCGMIALSLVAMYALMYAMVNSFSDIFPNVDQLYMAGLMTAPMVVIELFVMSRMYGDKKLNVLILVMTLVAFSLFFLGIRKQAFVTDVQFLRSMIPHHSSAILMCSQASLQDAEIKQLCDQIIAGQQSEIDWMKGKLIQLEQEIR
jgi:Domain of unknown function (DUF305)